MGGDHGPSVVIPALVRAVTNLPQEVRFLLHGDEATITAGLAKHPDIAARCEIRHAERVLSPPNAQPASNQKTPLRV